MDNFYKQIYESVRKVSHTDNSKIVEKNEN